MSKMEGAVVQQGPGDEGQISVRFTTKLPAEFQVPDTPIAVPANLARYGLSQIINHMLALDPPRPFDFLVHDQLLRLSLHKHLLAQQISTEAVLEVEYLPAVLPPTPREEHPHDDWVASLAALGDATLAAGCYDGVVRLWSGGECSSSWAAHAGPVKAAAAVAGSSGAMLLTAGKDNVARLWRDLDATQPEAVAVLKGHADSIEAAAASPSGALCCTGGWDSKLLLWRCGGVLVTAAEEGAGEQQGGGKRAAAKKRKVGAQGVAVAAHEEAPRLELTGGHSQCVSALCWPTEGTLVSGSWDHSVRQWDVETATNTETLHHNKVVYAVAAAPGGSGAPVAFGGAERALQVWDPRTRVGEGLAIRACTSHTDWIVGVAWHPSSAHHVATASHDKTAKLWDLRAAVPLHTMEGHTDKVLCAAWTAGGRQLATGGADSKLRTFEVVL